MPLLTWLVFWPLLSGLAVFLLSERRARHWVLVASLAELALAIVMIADLQPTPSWQFEERWPWLPPLGLTFHVGVDGISAYLVLAVACLGPLALLAAINSSSRYSRAFFFWLLAFEGAMIGALVSLDLLVFYIFWEVMLLPAFFLVGVWGGEQRIRATVKFALMTLVGSLTMLLAILCLGASVHATTGQWGFDYTQVFALKFSPDEEVLLFMAFMAAFAVKIPLFPLHVWLPAAYAEAPTPAVMLMSGVMAKLGVYGMVRFAIPLFPHVATGLAPVIAVLAVFGIIYGALLALGQGDAKRLVAYSSFSHLGWITLGILSFNVEGVTGGVYHMLSHAVGSAALFLLLGILWDRVGSLALVRFGGLANFMPWLASSLVLVSLGSLGLPGLAGFVGEFMILLGTFGKWPILAAMAGLGLVFGAVYMLYFLQRVLFGPGRDPFPSSVSRKGTHGEPSGNVLGELTWQEGVAVAPLAILTVVMGLWPGPILDRIEPAARTFVDTVALRRDPSKPVLPSGFGSSRPPKLRK